MPNGLHRLQFDPFTLDPFRIAMSTPCADYSTSATGEVLLLCRKELTRIWVYNKMAGIKLKS